MEALVAVGLATNIITFVDFAAKLWKGAKEISEKGSISQLDWIQDGTEELQQFIMELTKTAEPPTDDANKQLGKLAKDCADTAEEMIKLLDKVKEGCQKSSGLYKFRMLGRSLMKKGELESIQTRLNSYRSLILDQIVFIIRRDQTSLFKLTEDIRKRQVESADQLKNQLDSTRLDLIAALDKSDNDTAQDHSAIRRLLQEVTSKVEGLVSLDANAKRNAAVLDKLWFSDMLSREASVNDPSGKSYRWVLQPPYDSSESLDMGDEDSERKAARSHFNQWLEFESGLFYISGKPGSGKSTLMKFLAQDTHTQHQLQKWAAAAGRKLVLARFFFWISGTTLQKSVEGLYRAILWEILTQCPDLIPNVFPARWKDHEDHKSRVSHVPMCLSEAREAFGLLQKSLDSRHAVCLFIDGLDEYDGDYWKLGNELASWKSAHVKICVSARPYNGFQQTLPLDSSRHFQLEDLNRRDMLEHTRCELLKDERFCQLQNQDPSSTREVVRNLARNAEGVFLWTVLAIKYILQALTSQYSADQLLEMLNNDIPKDLEDMFLQMFDRIPQSEKRLASISLLVMSDPLIRLCFFEFPEIRSSLMFHWYIEQTIQDMALYDAGQDVKTSRLNLQQSPKTQIKAAKMRLNSRCAGFINRTYYNEYLFQITHRTLGDFLRQPSIKTKLLALSGDVDIHLVLSKTCLNILRDYGGPQTVLHSSWPGFWFIFEVLANIAECSGGHMEFIDKIMLSAFDFRRTVPSICVRSDLCGGLDFSYTSDYGHRFCHANIIPQGYHSHIEYEVGLVQQLSKLMVRRTWNFITRTKKQLIGFIPESAKTALILTTVLSALSDSTKQHFTEAFDFAESLLEMGSDNSSEAPINRSLDGNHQVGIWFGTYFARKEYSTMQLFGSDPSIWELILLAASTEILSAPKASWLLAFAKHGLIAVVDESGLIAVDAESGRTHLA
ncbi:hypothetical protein PG988_003476 [Apiospora saccharicola]